MATAITTPTQTSLEAQVLETVSALAEAEKALTEPLDNVVITPNLEDNTVTLSVSLPITIAASAGEITLTAVPYAI